MVSVYETAKSMMMNDSDGLVLTLEYAKRTVEQNRKMWAMLNDISTQVLWHGIRLTNEEWKDLLTAGLKGANKVVPNVEGTGFVILGQRTSKMNKKEFVDLIEFIYFFGTQRGVVFSDDAVMLYDELIKSGAIKA